MNIREQFDALIKEAQEKSAEADRIIKEAKKIHEDAMKEKHEVEREMDKLSDKKKELEPYEATKERIDELVEEEASIASGKQKNLARTNELIRYENRLVEVDTNLKAKEEALKKREDVLAKKEADYKERLKKEFLEELSKRMT